VHFEVEQSRKFLIGGDGALISDGEQANRIVITYSITEGDVH